MEMVVINGQKMPVRVFDGQRVVTFRDIDTVHGRPDGTASRNFRENKKHFILNEDYFVIKPSDIQTDEIRHSGIIKETNNRGTYFMTETGYLMIVKSFTDDLAWSVQRQLVNAYFRTKEILQSEKKSLAPQNDFSALCVQVNGIENTLDNFYDRLNALEEVINHATPSTTVAYIGMDQKPIIDPIRDNIERLAVLYGDGSNGYNCTFRKVYLAMGVDWKYRRTRYKNQKGNKNAPSKLQLIESDKKLLKLFIETVENLIAEAEGNR